MKKEINVKKSPLFQEQIKKLENSVKEKDSKFNKQLLKAIEKEIKDLYKNSHSGVQVQKKKIPKEYIEKYGVTNLWKINLPNYWRMIYTITGNEIEIISVLLEFIDHKEYNKKFGYKKK